MYTLTPAAAGRSRRKVIFLGLRGIPEVQGGVETHVAALAVRIAARDWQVEVLGRKPYLPSPEPYVWKGVTVTPVWTPRSKSFEALLHTALGLLVAARRKPDLVHIHAIGPALLTPLARLLGLRVVVTHHGFDYDRQKWGDLAKSVLRAGERMGMSFAHARIGVSKGIVDSVRLRFGVAASFIPNGVETDLPKFGTSYLDYIDVAPRRYVLCVGRIVEEKRQLDLISAFARLNDPDVKLIIVGTADHKGGYLHAVEAAAAATPGVVMTGFQTGEALAQLYQHAGLFVLPSSHEGMPMVLLEALSHGTRCLASDIDANLALDLGADSYYPLGDVAALAAAMRMKLATPDSAADREARAARVMASFGWSPIVDRTIEVYESALVAWKAGGAHRGGTGLKKHLEIGGH
ncbi:glycosyltransferase family 4 protein [Bradyrhizobium sp. WSM 1704]|uniref:glycosyltransferase family 4 protein n=1 Tax=Bradyrhizobium semiaridum TaxID=2821404 RepID=UPI001CE2A4F7|nr:glycosyltransferase family 4 protein [Bradyrhizobium semiaridum]MCA6124950.1 glycosyltransferase family 4 protein [Bradyrhizobium semiaridum]